jgi:sulfide:quinone oxidoreductase
MAATELRDRGIEPEITIVTPEPAPLWVFGEYASGAVAELLMERGIAVRVGARAPSVRKGVLELAEGPGVVADRVIALPRLVGPAIAGLPHGAHGFIPVDAHGRVPEVPDVFAAGDATTFPLKQGGLACQQADVAAEAIAADLGVAVTPAPFRPVMRGLLLTGGAPLYLRPRRSAGPRGAPRRPPARPRPLPAEWAERRDRWMAAQLVNDGKKSGLGASAFDSLDGIPLVERNCRG